jgi:hypothetical protein
VTDSATQEIVRSRRAVLAAAAGGAAALAASALGPATVAAAAANMQTETDNATTAPTGVSNSTDGSDALFGNATGAGTGSKGTSGKGMGVVGTSADTTDPAINTTNAGVVGVAGAIGSISSNIALTGVYGYSDPSPDPNFTGAGVWGDCDDFGVIGTGSLGVYGNGGLGVVGATGNGEGVRAWSDTISGIALRTVGRAEFSRSGRTYVAAGHSTRAVTLAGCTSSTLVIAVLSSNRSGRYVRAVVPASGKFTIYLNSTVSTKSYVTWIAFTNPSNHGG